MHFLTSLPSRAQHLPQYQSRACPPREFLARLQQGFPSRHCGTTRFIISAGDYVTIYLYSFPTTQFTVNRLASVRLLSRCASRPSLPRPLLRHPLKLLAASRFSWLASYKSFCIVSAPSFLGAPRADRGAYPDEPDRLRTLSSATFRPQYLSLLVRSPCCRGGRRTIDDGTAGASSVVRKEKSKGI